jgi:hypothetical protein
MTEVIRLCAVLLSLQTQRDDLPQSQSSVALSLMGWSFYETHLSVPEEILPQTYQEFRKSRPGRELCLAAP